ncbi:MULTISPECIES: hypothetical protein [Sulfitobacter]|uniref:Uncharacterized protein n=1 Tax=Sulfitobacter profundi TaxID=2679961 RepID=A0ABW1YTT1_9RHOB|nr:hypothetical protein [Sulfitobacter indolifex]
MSQNDQRDAHLDAFIGMVDQSHDVSYQLGLIVANFAVLEFLLVILGAAALGEDDDRAQSQVICGRVRNFSDRCQIVKDLVQMSAHVVENRETLTSFVDEMFKLNAVRNLYVHGLWEGNMNGDAWVTPYVTTAGRKGQKRKVDPDELAHTVSDIRSLVGRVFRELQITTYPVSV